MNLCIDQGNSRTKVALFDDGKLIKAIIYKTFHAADIERLFSLYTITDSIISSVVNIEPAVVNILHRNSKHFVLFDHYTPLPITNTYHSPETLGQDRLAAAIGAVFLCPHENLLIIDAGSAITYDFVSENNEYIGGNIAPGVKMRLTILNRMTKKLPLVEVEDNELIPLFGKTTRDAIAAGVVRGIAFEVKGYIRTLSERCKHFTVFLTGGNAPYILNNCRFGKSSTDDPSEPNEKRVIPAFRLEKNLVLIGLNQILEFNK
jgi:type III pantothenate kinase